MRRLIGWLGAGMGMGLLILLAAAQAQEKKVALSKVPKPVLEAVKARFQGAAVTGASQETTDGKTVYEVTLKPKGQNIDVTLSPEGEILMIEKEIAARHLPQAVAQALADKYPKAKYKLVEEIIKVEQKEEKLAYYEAQLVTAAKQALEVQVTAEGKILKEEKKGSGKDDK